MRTLAIMNLKGGTGKTVTAINLAADLAGIYGQRVLLVDADSQGNLTEFVSRVDNVEAGGIADLLRGNNGFPVPTSMQNVKILQADASLMALDISSAGNGSADTGALKDFRAKNEDKYDWMIIDCPPAFSAAAAAALVAADAVVIPMKLDAFGIRGMANLLEQIRNMQRINRKLKVAGVLPTIWYNSFEQKETEDQLRSAMDAIGVHVFHHIRRSVQVDAMTFSQMPLIQSSPKSGACRDYKLFTRELMEGGGY